MLLWQDELNPRVRCAFGNVFLYLLFKIACPRFSLNISCVFKKKNHFKFPVQDGSKLGPFTLSPGHQRAGGNIFLCQQNLLFNLVFVHICLCILSYFHLMYLQSSFEPTAALARRRAGPGGDSG